MPGHTRHDGDTGPADTSTGDVATVTAAASTGPPEPALDPMQHLPRWIPRLIALIMVAVFATMAIFWLLVRLRTLIVLVIISLFLSFALEPGVNWLARKGWRRGPATAVMFVALIVVVFGLLAAMIPLVVAQVGELIDTVPTWLDDLSKYSEQWFKFELSTENIVDQLRNLGSSVSGFAGNVAGNILGFGAAVLTAVFQALAVLLFTFYLVADGPRVRRTVCSLLRPERQADVLNAWDIAIDRTGGYLYSRLLLAVISGAVSYVVLLALGVEFAAALALWLAFMSQFIPTVGTYIGALLPLIVAVLDDPLAALIFLIYVIVYQQIENLFLSPRVTAHTMELHPAIAFAAVIAGASIMGAVGAFLALPAAAILQAGIGTYITRHEVMESDLTRVREKKPPGKLSRWIEDLLKRDKPQD